MKSGLEGRNNEQEEIKQAVDWAVSMKSGLEGRNNTMLSLIMVQRATGSQ